jgi:Protein of unknown function (DUF1648)
MMTRLQISVIVLALSMLAMALSLAAAATLLPAQVASHFNAAGQPDAWTSRTNHMVMMGFVGLGLPLIMASIFWVVRFLPAAVVNLPHREYWLAPARRPQTAAILLELGLWFVALQNLFFLVIHWLVVAANRQAPVQLSWVVWPALIVYLLLVGGWLWCLWRRFQLPRMNGKDGFVKHCPPYSSTP